MIIGTTHCSRLGPGNIRATLLSSCLFKLLLKQAKYSVDELDLVPDGKSAALVYSASLFKIPAVYFPSADGCNLLISCTKQGVIAADMAGGQVDGVAVGADRRIDGVVVVVVVPVVLPGAAFLACGL